MLVTCALGQQSYYPQGGRWTLGMDGIPGWLPLASQGFMPQAKAVLRI